MSEASASPTQAGDILSAIRASMPELSKSHRRIAEMILADPQTAVQSNVEELAERAGVAKPTVVRFARSIGCEGLKDFKLRLAGTLALGANYLHRAVKPADSHDEVLDNIVGSTLTVISEWRRTLDPATFAAAADVVSRARRVDCWGTGQTSQFLALDFQARLFRMGMQATSYTDAYLQLVSAATITEADVAVAISFVGRMPGLLDAVDTAQARGAKVIAITTSDTPLARKADIVLPVDVPADATMPVGTDAYITQILVIEMLSILVGRTRGPECIRQLEQIHRLMRDKVRDSDQTSVVYWGWKSPSGEQETET